MGFSKKTRKGTAKKLAGGAAAGSPKQKGGLPPMAAGPPFLFGAMCRGKGRPGGAGTFVPAPPGRNTGRQAF